MADKATPMQVQWLRQAYNGKPLRTKEISTLVKKGWVKVVDGKVKLTREGVRVMMNNEDKRG